jgi:hypothetical protein
MYPVSKLRLAYSIDIYIAYLSYKFSSNKMAFAGLTFFTGIYFGYMGLLVQDNFVILKGLIAYDRLFLYEKVWMENVRRFVLTLWKTPY